MQNAAMAAKRRSDTGGEAVFTAQLEPLLQPAYRLACAMLHDPQLAEDAVQVAAVKAWRKLHRLRSGSEMRPWFLGIVANECRNTRRSGWWSRLGDLIGERSVEEVARASGLSVHATESRLARAIRTLRKELAND